MNKERLLKVRDQILAEAVHFDMSFWIVTGGGRKRSSVHDLSQMKGSDKKFQCGTTCCLAGHAVLVAQADGFVFEPDILIGDAAAAYLDMEEESDYQKLFHVENWPPVFRDRYDAASVFGGIKTMAQTTADYIDFLVAGL